MRMIDMIKQGAAVAADKAQQAVELTKLTARVHSKKKQLEANLTKIGEAVYRAYQSRNLPSAEPLISRLSKENEAIEAEIQALEEKMRQLRQQQVCRCGASAPLTAVYCPRCGVPFASQRIIVGSGPGKAAIDERDKERGL